MTTRIALVVGINYYEHGNPLFGCVNDAYEVKAALERNGDGSVNFDCKILAAIDHASQIRRSQLKDQIAELFSAQADVALLYFSGHGHVEATGGYLLSSDAQRGDGGVSLSEIVTLASISQIANKIIVLDSCHSGIAADSPTSSEATLTPGMTVLTASTTEQYATEDNGRGIFTGLFVDALSGGAASLTGDVTLGSVYAHIDQSLGPWEQRPVFKTNVKRFVSLRKVTPSISLDDLHRISEFFPAPGYEFSLDPTFEPEIKGRDEGMPLPDPKNTAKFAILQKYNRLNLLVPVDAPHMWHAAMQSKSCKLTALGEHYRRLVVKNRI